MRLVLALLVLTFLACGARQVLPAPKALVVRVSYENNLRTMRACEYLGIVHTALQGDGLGANLIVAFVLSETTSAGSTTHGWTGKAVRCPQALVDEYKSLQLSQRSAP